MSVVRCVFVTVLLLLCTAFRDDPALAAGSSSPPEAAIALLDVFSAPPVPTGDALWDRYSAAVFERASTAAQRQQGWHPAFVPESVLIDWHDMVPDPRFFELREFCSIGAANWYLLDGQNELPEGEALWRLIRDATDFAEVLKERKEASITMRLRFLELQMDHAYRLWPELSGSAGEEGGWMTPEDRAEFRGGLFHFIGEEGKLLRTLVREMPDEAWAHYSLAEFYLQQNDYQRARESIRAGNSAAHAELPRIFPLSYVHEHFEDFKDPGNLAVAGLVLDAELTDDPPLLLRDYDLFTGITDQALQDRDLELAAELRGCFLRLAQARTADPQLIQQPMTWLARLNICWAPPATRQAEAMASLDYATTSPLVFYGGTQPDLWNLPAGRLAYFWALPGAQSYVYWQQRIGQPLSEAQQAEAIQLIPELAQRSFEGTARQTYSAWAANALQATASSRDWYRDWALPRFARYQALDYGKAGGS